MLTAKDKEEVKELIVEGIKDVVMPVFETLATKKDLEGLVTKKDLEKLASKDELHKVEDRLTGRLDSMDRKLDKVVDIQLDHEVRIKKLEHIQVSP